MRDSLLQNFGLNYLRNKLRIINIYNTGQKNYHRLYNISLGKKFIMNSCEMVMTF